MRLLPIGLLSIALAGWACTGCGGCGHKSEPPKPAARPPTRPPAKPPAPPPERKLVTPSRTHEDDLQHSPRQYRPGTQTATPEKPMSIVKMPQVTRQEVEADPRLNNPNIPMGSKRTLKILEKVQKNNPNLTKPDSWFKPEPAADRQHAGAK